MRPRASRIRQALPWLARLALFSLLFQVTALDHQWHPPSEAIEGVIGSSDHVLHCHGQVSGCANGGTDLPATLETPAVLPAGVLPVLLSSLRDFGAPPDADVALIKEPPRA